MSNKDKFSLGVIFKVVSKVSGIPEKDFSEPGQKRVVCEARHSFYILCGKYAEYRYNKEITDYISKNHSGFYHAKKLTHIPEIKSIIKKTKDCLFITD